MSCLWAAVGRPTGVAAFDAVAASCLALGLRVPAVGGLNASDFHATTR